MNKLSLHFFYFYFRSKSIIQFVKYFFISKIYKFLYMNWYGKVIFAHIVVSYNSEIYIKNTMSNTH